MGDTYIHVVFVVRQQNADIYTNAEEDADDDDSDDQDPFVLMLSLLWLPRQTGY